MNRQLADLLHYGLGAAGEVYASAHKAIIEANAYTEAILLSVRVEPFPAPKNLRDTRWRYADLGGYILLTHASSMEFADLQVSLVSMES